MPLAKGSQRFREGNPGDRLYLIEKGELDVEVDGTLVATLVPGDYVGEIASLRGAPRAQAAKTSPRSALWSHS